eukprot:c35431_g1_i1 orf=108-290(+)
MSKCVDSVFHILHAAVTPDSAMEGSLRATFIWSLLHIAFDISALCVVFPSTTVPIDVCCL